MDCTKADELIAAGDMTGGLRRHLEECSRCRAEHEAAERLIARLGSVEAPEPPEEFWVRLRSDVRQAISDADNAEDVSSNTVGRLLFPFSLRQGALVSAMLVIALVSVFVIYMPGYRLPEIEESPALQEIAEAGVEIYLEMDEDEVAITSMILEWDDSIYYELYGLSDEEMANFYDSLGLMIESRLKG